MADQNPVLSYEILLAKKQFDEKMGKLGYNAEKMATNWEKLKLFFDLSLMQYACEMLSVEEQNNLVGKVSPYSDQEEIKKFIARVKEYLKANPGKVDYSKILEKSVTNAYNELAEFLKK